MTDGGPSEKPLPAIQGRMLYFSTWTTVFSFICVPVSLTPSTPQLECKLFEGRVTDLVIVVSSAVDSGALELREFARGQMC